MAQPPNDLILAGVVSEVCGTSGVEPSFKTNDLFEMAISAALAIDPANCFILGHDNSSFSPEELNRAIELSCRCLL